MSEFATCAQCGRIFANPGGQHNMCTRCRGDETHELSTRDALRLLKGTLRDAQARSELMTIPELSKATGVDEQRIWGFISDGEIDTASFNDPQVRDFVFKRRRELLKQSQAPAEEKAQPQEHHHGFHHRNSEDERRR
jgi:hypothetical protein